MEIFVENIKCGGCINSIKKTLESIPEVNVIDIDLEQQKITLHANESQKVKIIQKLNDMGYPEVGHNSLFNKAKSYVSCSIGKITS